MEWGSGLISSAKCEMRSSESFLVKGCYMTRLIIGLWVVLSVGLGVVEAQEAQWMAVLVNGKKVGYYKKIPLRMSTTKCVL